MYSIIFQNTEHTSKWRTDQKQNKWGNIFLWEKRNVFFGPIPHRSFLHRERGMVKSYKHEKMYIQLHVNYMWIVKTIFFVHEIVKIFRGNFVGKLSCDMTIRFKHSCCLNSCSKSENFNRKWDLNLNPRPLSSYTSNMFIRITVRVGFSTWNKWRPEGWEVRHQCYFRQAV